MPWQNCANLQRDNLMPKAQISGSFPYGLTVDAKAGITVNSQRWGLASKGTQASML